MKVSNTNNISFKSSQVVTKPLDENLNNKTEIKELSNVTPDFAVRTPQSYKKISETDIPNGLKIHSYKLANGYRVSIIPMEGSPATVKNYVNVGAFNEPDNIKGISHFLEHMAFNGTNGNNNHIKLNQGDSFKKIEILGGWTNASTGHALTDYVNSTPLLEDRDLEEQIKVIAAMTEDLALTEEMIEKEKGPVCSEINMIMDRPETTAYDQTLRTLFNIRSSADELIAGSTKHIQNLTKKDVKEYYNKHYTPDNMNLVITGDVNPDEVIKLVAKNFHSKKTSSSELYHESLTPIKSTVRKDFINKTATSTMIELGFVGPKNSDVKSKVIHELLEEYISSVYSGFNKALKPLNTQAIISNNKITNEKNGSSLITVDIETSEENSEKALKILHEKLASLKSPNKKNLEILKKRLLENYDNRLSYSGYINDIVGKSTFDNSLEYLTKYPEIVSSITEEDVNNYIEKYIDLSRAAITVVHPKTTIEEINKNYNKTNNISFKGKDRTPVNPENISETVLDNNYKIGFIKTKNNNNLKFSIKYSYKLPRNINPAAFIILDNLFGQGTSTKTEEEFKRVQEDNNYSIFAGNRLTSLSLKGSANCDNFKEAVNSAKELIVNPRLTQKEFNDAVERALDKLKQQEVTAESLYYDYFGKSSELVISNEKIKEGLKTLTLDDIKNLHKYILENSCATIAINIPEKNEKIKEIAIKEFSGLNKVKPFRYIKEHGYIENSKPVVITKNKDASQADIIQLYTFPAVDTPKEKITLRLLNSLLTSSSTIGLFNTLREKEKLAYSVYSDIDRVGDTGELSLNILTTTDNKETGEQSFENVQKSINGFHRQIQCLLNSEYTDEDLISVKKAYKAVLLDNEGIPSKVSTLSGGLNDEMGIYRDNIKYKLIDEITREDIDTLAQKVFKNPPMYFVVGSEDTLKANQTYFESLKS